MADPAASDARNAGNPTDEEDRPDLARIDVMLANLTEDGRWSFDSTPGAQVISTASGGIDIVWVAPDMEGHPDAIANGELIAQAPALLRQCVDEIRRLEELAGIVR